MSDYFDEIQIPKNKEKEKSLDDLLDVDDRDPSWYPGPTVNVHMPLDGHQEGEVDFDEYIEFGD
jgi:hypothetical protein